MEFKVNNLINNKELFLFINSNDTVYDVKNLICSSQYSNQRIFPSGINLYYKDKISNKINYMLSPYRTIFSYNGIIQTRELFIEETGFQLDSILAILLENILPIITIYYLYNKEEQYTKLIIHKLIVFLTFVYFICRFFINLKYNNKGKYQLSKLILNIITYWIFFSLFCGYSIFDDELGEMNIYSYFFGFICLFSEFLSLKLLKEYKYNILRNIIFDYVKYPFYLMDCFVWLSIAFIIFNKKIFYFTIFKIFYNIYLAFEEYIKERGVKRTNNINNYYKYNKAGLRYKNLIKNNNQKIIFPFIL